MVENSKTTTQAETRARAARAIVRAGDGRGFVLATGAGRVIVTAAHCLPTLPIAASAADAEKRTYRKLLGRVGDLDPQVTVECLFVDPVADIAVLGRPDSQALYEDADLYDALIEGHLALRIGDASAAAHRPSMFLAWVLSLDGEWIKCRVAHRGGPLWISHATGDLVAGMLGSPIVSEDGAAIGVLVTTATFGGGAPRAGGPQPRLTESLPGRWLRQGPR